VRADALGYQGRKCRALLNLVYRDQLFPRRAYARAFEALCAKVGDKWGLQVQVEPLALAHDRTCEAELARVIDAELERGRLPQQSFPPRSHRAPERRSLRYPAE
jgi:hypothetical protein